MAETQVYKARKADYAAKEAPEGTQTGTLAPKPLIGEERHEAGGWTEWVGILGLSLIVAGIVWAAYWTVTTFFISRELQGQRKFGVVGTFLWIAALIGAGMALRAFVSE